MNTNHFLSKRMRWRVLIFIILFSAILYVFWYLSNVLYLTRAINQSRYELTEKIDSAFKDINTFVKVGPISFPESRVEVMGFLPNNTKDLHYTKFRKYSGTNDYSRGYPVIEEKKVFRTAFGGTKEYKSMRTKDRSQNYDAIDSVEFVNRYGSFNSYFIYPHTNDSWKLVIFERKDKTSFVCDTIIPKIIGYKNKMDSSYVAEEIKIRLLSRFKITDNIEYINSLKELRTKYHVMVPYTYKFSFSDEGSINTDDYVMNYRKKSSTIFIIEKDTRKEHATAFLLLFTSILLSILFSYFIVYKLISKQITRVFINKKETKDSISYNVLLNQIKPQNFYNSSQKKQKAAQRLYNILLNYNDDDEEIVSMVYEKAKKLLDIE